VTLSSTAGNKNIFVQFWTGDNNATHYLTTGNIDADTIAPEVTTGYIYI